MKVSIIGGGGVVGSSAAYRIAQDGLVSEIILVDIRRNLAEAHALDIEQAVVYRTKTIVRAGDISDTKGSDVILISVGAVGRPMHSSRASHFGENVEIIKNLSYPQTFFNPKGKDNRVKSKRYFTIPMGSCKSPFYSTNIC